MTGGHAWKYLGGVAFQCKPKKNLLCYELGDRFSYRGHFFGCGNTPLKACIIYNTALLLSALFLIAQLFYFQLFYFQLFYY